MRFREIPGWPGYRVSDTGIVECCKNHGGKITEAWHQLKQMETRDGYLQVHLCNHGISRLRRVHSLVLLTFVGPCPDGQQACHSNGDRQDNTLINLRWDTIQANIRDRDSHGNTARGERSGRSKLKEIDVIRVRNLRDSGLSYGKVAKEIQISKRQVMRICKGESWANTKR